MNYRFLSLWIGRLNPRSHLVFAFLAAVALAAIATAYASRASADAEASFDSDLVSFLKRSDYALLTASRLDAKPSSNSTSFDAYSLAGESQLLFHHLSSVNKAHDKVTGLSSQLRPANIQVAITASQAIEIIDDAEMTQDSGSSDGEFDTYSGNIDVDGRYYQLALMFPK